MNFSTVTHVSGLTPGGAPSSLDLFVIVNLLAVTVLYLWLARRTPAWSRASTACFLGAIVALALAYVSPLNTWAHVVFWAHMSQHLLVLMIAGPLLVLSSPIRLAFLNLGPTGRRRIIDILRSRPVEVLTNPIVGWLLFATVLLGSHAPLVMNWSVSDHDAMDFVIRPLYLVAAYVFYYPLIGRDLIAKRPAPSIRVASLGLMMIPETVLGMVIHFAPVPLYDAYVRTTSVAGIDALTDQKFAGAMMWAIAMVLDGFWMMLAALEWWREQERETTRLERRERRDAVVSS